MGTGSQYGAATYLVRRRADAEDEPRGEVGPGDVRGRGPRRPERGQEEENSRADERLPHHAPVSAPARLLLPQRVSSSLFAGRPRSRGCGFYIFESVGRGGRPFGVN